MAAAAQTAANEAKQQMLAFIAKYEQDKAQQDQNLEALVTINTNQRQELVGLQAQLAGAMSSAEADRARSLKPSNLPVKLETKIQPSLDTLPLLREAYVLLCRDEPDIPRAKLLVGQAYRLANNVLAGAELAKQHPASERPFDFVDIYYDLTKPLALRPPLDAEAWRPEDELVKHDAARKSANKQVEADITKVKAAAAAAAAAAANGGGAFKRRGPPFVGQQQRPFAPFPPFSPPASNPYVGGGHQRGPAPGNGANNSGNGGGSSGAVGGFRGPNRG